MRASTERPHLLLGYDRSMPESSSPSADRLHRYRIAAAGMLFFHALIVVTGATVRLTGSGLGCPDWPRCHGTRLIPTAVHGQQVIEFGNRMMTTPVSAFTIAALVFAVLLKRRDLIVGCSLVLAGVVGQVVLGGMSVIFKLSPVLVSAHFLTSILTLMAATWAFHASGSTVRMTIARNAAGERDRALMTTAIVLLAVSAIVIVAGVLTTASGPHSGGAAGQAIERLGIWRVAVVVHARLSFAFAALVVGLTLWRRRSQAGVRDLVILTALIALQITLGEIQFRNGLPWQVVLIHVANATVMWCWICMITWKAAAVPVTSAQSGLSSQQVGAGRAQPVG